MNVESLNCGRRSALELSNGIRIAVDLFFTLQSLLVLFPKDRMEGAHSTCCLYFFRLQEQFPIAVHWSRWLIFIFKREMCWVKTIPQHANPSINKKKKKSLQKERCSSSWKRKIIEVTFKCLCTKFGLKNDVQTCVRLCLRHPGGSA